jgi:hypothetical protein
MAQQAANFESYRTEHRCVANENARLQAAERELAKSKAEKAARKAAKPSKHASSIEAARLLKELTKNNHWLSKEGCTASKKERKLQGAAQSASVYTAGFPASFKPRLQVPRNHS